MNQPRGQVSRKEDVSMSCALHEQVSVDHAVWSSATYEQGEGRRMSQPSQAISILEAGKAESTSTLHPPFPSKAVSTELLWPVT